MSREVPGDYSLTWLQFLASCWQIVLSSSKRRGPEASSAAVQKPLDRGQIAWLQRLR